MVKKLPASAGDIRDTDLMGWEDPLELGRSPGERNYNPLQYFCLENPMDRGAWWTRVHGIVKNQTQLND